MDKYENFEDLKNEESSESFMIEFRDHESPFLIFAPHAGGIEPGTSEICRHIAGDSYSYYLFAGIGNNCTRLHITSAKFDEPTLHGLLLKHQYAVSIHGMTNEMKNEVGADIFLGGLNQALIGITTKILRDCHSETTNNIKNPESKLSGKDQRNITNTCLSGEGMQVEISEDLREKFFQGDYKRKNGRKETTEEFKNFCDVIVQSIATYEKRDAKR